MGITLRFFTERDAGALTQFNREVSGKEFPPSYWIWKYLRSPAGEATVAVAFDDNKIIGCLGVQHVKMKVGTHEILAGQVVDTQILEGYRKDGLISHLAKYAYEEFVKRKTGEMLFGFGPEITTNLATKFGAFSEVGPVQKMVKVVDPTSHIQNKLRIPYFSHLIGALMRSYIIMKERGRAKGDSFHIREIQQCDSRFDELWLRAAKKEIMVVRDSGYLSWRYMTCPVTNYKILVAEKEDVLQGYIIVYTIKKDNLIRGTISDFVILPDAVECGEMLFARAILYLYSKGAVIVSSWFPKDTFVSPILKRVAFVERPSYNYLVAKPLTEGISHDLLRDERNWYYTFGDNDWVGSA